MQVAIKLKKLGEPIGDTLLGKTVSSCIMHFLPYNLWLVHSDQIECEVAQVFEMQKTCIMDLICITSYFCMI